jgi:hypothetical protein
MGWRRLLKVLGFFSTGTMATLIEVFHVFYPNEIAFVLQCLSKLCRTFEHSHKYETISLSPPVVFRVPKMFYVKRTMSCLPHPYLARAGAVLAHISLRNSGRMCGGWHIGFLMLHRQMFAAVKSGDRGGRQYELCAISACSEEQLYRARVPPICGQVRTSCVVHCGLCSQLTGSDVYPGSQCIRIALCFHSTLNFGICLRIFMCSVNDYMQQLKNEWCKCTS